MPSTEALLLHWKRSIWVLAMWNCATHNTVDLPGWLDNIHTYNSNMTVHVPYMYIHILGTVHIHVYKYIIQECDVHVHVHVNVSFLPISQ